MKLGQNFSLGILGLGILLTSTPARTQNVLIVANKDVSISRLSSSQIRELFTGVKSRFSDGSRAVPVVLRGGPAHEVFLHKHLSETPEDFRSQWRRLVFTGQGSMLKEFASESAMLEYITVTPGAIGYVSRVNNPEAVKILTVSP